MRSTVAISIAAAALALGLSACSEDPATVGLTKAEFVGNANAICKKYERKVEAIGTRVFAPDVSESAEDSLDRYGTFVDELAPLSEAAIDELSALVPDDEALAARWSAYVREFRAGLDAFKEAGAAAKRNDRAGVQAAADRAEGLSPDAGDVLGPGACAD